MSPTLKRLCPGCRTTLIASPARRCASCSKAYEQGRGSARQRGYDARHAAWRRVVLATYPDCADCGAPGQPDDHADHLVALAAGGDWSVENGRRRCHRCHSRKTVRTDGGLGRPRASAGPSRGGYSRGGQEVQAPPSQGPRVSENAGDVGAALARHPQEDGGA